MFAAAILACAASFLHAKEDPVARQLLDAALQQARPYLTASAPYALDSDFTIQGGVPIQGHYILKWQAQDQWWSRVEVAGFVQTTIRDGELEYTLRNLPPTPTRVTDLFSLFGFVGIIKQLVLDKQKLQTDNGTEEICLRAHSNNAGGWGEELCIDQVTHDLLKETQRTPPEQTRLFGNYIEFNGRRYPRQLDLFIKGTKVVSATVTSMVAAPSDPALLVPPKGAIERRKCVDMKPPVLLKQVDPDIGSPRDHPGVVSRTMISFTILTDGTVSDAYVAERGADFMNEPSLKAIKQLRFKPAMCGSQPIVLDTAIEIDFASDRRQ